MKRLVMIGVALLALAACARRPAAPAAAPGGAMTVSGTVTYRLRVALPPSAQVLVQLVDAARADAPAPVVAQQVIPTEGAQVPIAFALHVPPGAVAPTARLRLQARITVDGELRFVSKGAYPVPTSGPRGPIEIVVEPAQ